MKIKTDTLKGKIAVLALIGEVLIGLGCTWIILSHYYSLTEGATIISSAGVLLTLVFACAGLHFLITGETQLFRVVSCCVWVGLTLVESALAITIWMGTQHGKDLASSRKEITAKQQQLRSTRDREERRQIQQDIAELRQTGADAFDEQKQPELHWLYHTGIHSLPFPCGFLGMFLIVVFGVIQSKEEDEAKGAKPKQTEPQSTPQRSGNPPARPVGFQPQTVTAKDKSPKDQAPWI